MKDLTQEAIELLQHLIQLPSYSREENETAKYIEHFFKTKGKETQRSENNVWVKSQTFDPNKKTLLLNSHHDTVKPNSAYSRNPFEAVIEGNQLFGLGSNDAGASLVSLIQTFLFFEGKKLPFNLILLASAEEEVSGKNGVESVLSYLPEIDVGIVGEPTEMKMAIAEKGLLVIDAIAKGLASHAAHVNPDNAIYKAMRDISWISSYDFPIQSDFLGKVHMSVSQISAGEKHNQIPAEAQFTLDVRVPETYSLEQVFDTIDQNTESSLQARSFRLRPSKISCDHSLVRAGQSLGLELYGSPTLSDQALMTFPTVKIGPGKSERSHAPDEFVLLSEIEEGIQKYIKLIEKYAEYEVVG